METHKFVPPPILGVRPEWLDEHHSGWKAPAQLLRDQRQAFYGPLTADMVSYKQPSNSAGAQVRSRAHWKHGGTQALAGLRVLHQFEDAKHLKCFRQWRDRPLVPFPKPAGTSDSEEEQDNGAGEAPTTPLERSGHHAERVDMERAFTATTNDPLVDRLPTRRARIRVETANNAPVFLRLICFHWEGGNSDVFAKLGQHDGLKHAQVLAVTLPGRLGRVEEPPLTGVWAAARYVADSMLGLGMHDAPFAFLGHGMGALIMYETARILRSEHNKKPKAMFALSCPQPQAFVEGAPPPGFVPDPEPAPRARSPFARDRPPSSHKRGGSRSGTPSTQSRSASPNAAASAPAHDPRFADHAQEGAAAEEKSVLTLSEQTDDRLVDLIMQLENQTVPKEVCHAVFTVALPLLRQDLKAMESYHYSADWPFSCNVCAIIGTLESRWPSSEAERWSAETTRAFDFLVIQGGTRSMLRDKSLLGQLVAYVDEQLSIALRDSWNDPEEVYVAIDDAL